MDPVADPQLLRKSDSARNRTRTSGSVARNSDHRGGKPLYDTARKGSAVFVACFMKARGWPTNVQLSLVTGTQY
jgi:hypothetical protein